ncbi:MAG TPA: hypothetical protein VGC21_03675 [Telluria sp.]|jgi:hypothetical protein
MQNHFQVTHSLQVLLAPALVWGSIAGAAELPPLGLYRIDTDGAMQYAGNPTRLQSSTDGASGDTTARWKSGEHSATRQFKGEGPVTHCVKAITGGAPLPPQALACKDQRTTVTKDGWLHSATCPHGKITLAIRQLDKDRWEYVNRVTMLSTGAAPSMAGMEMLLKQQAQHGATAQERAQAQQQLAQLPAMQTEADSKYAATIAQMKAEMEKTRDPEVKAALQTALARLAPGNPTMHGSARTIWTRIANTCN